MANAHKECLIRCDHCGEVNTVMLRRFLAFKWWKNQECRRCEKKLDPKDLVTVVCPHCGKLVQRTSDSRCLNCGKIVYREDEVFTVTCDNCGTTNLVPRKHEDVVTCSICGKPFPADKLKDKPQMLDEKPQYILLKDQQKMLDEDLVIWKHPLSEFSAKSRLQVSPGTTALFLQNGICQEPCGPGSYLLEKTGLSRQEKLTAAAEGEDVILKTEIFCVIDSLPEISWGTGSHAVPVRNAEGNKVYLLNASGTIVWNVANAKHFAEKVGFRNIYGKNELIRIDPTPGSQDAPLLRETRRVIAEGLRKVAGSLITLKRLDPENLLLEKSELETGLMDELDRVMTDYGLVVGNLKLNRIEAELDQGSGLTAETGRKETILKMSQKSYPWKAENVHLTVGNNQNLYADYSFSGSLRMRVNNETSFFDTPEIQNMPDDPQQAEQYFCRLIEEQTSACIRPAVQLLITEENLPIRNLDLYTDRMEAELMRRLNARLSGMGIGVESLHFDQPQYRQSAALKIEAEKNEREKKLIQYAEKPIAWRADPVEVHMKGDKGLSAQVVFSGTCTLNVTDRQLFFAKSGNQEFMEQDPFVDEATVNRSYAQQVSSHFYAKLAGLTQNMINNYDWDIRELEQYIEDLKVPAANTLDALIAGWGMTVQSVYLNKPQITPSFALQQLRDKESLKASTEIRKEADAINDDYEMTREQAEAKKTIGKDDIATEVDTHRMQNEAARVRNTGIVKDAQTEEQIDDLRRRERVEAQMHHLNMSRQGFETEEAVGGIRNEGLKDEAEDRRTAEAEARKKQLEQDLQKADIEKKNMADEARRKWERAEEEHQRILQDIQHQSGLDEARFKESLNEILRRIDQSDLDWRQKLDEYARMSHKLGIQDAEEARLLSARTGSEIASMQTASAYEAAMKKIQLSGTQAELQETIDRYAEDRAERKAKAAADRAERASILAFEQQMADRKQKAEEQMALLKEQYAAAVRDHEHDEREAGMKAEIEKLRLQLDVEKQRIIEEAGLGKARSADEARAREAEAAAAKERAEKQEQREDALMSRAESLFKYVTEIRQAMDKADKELQMHLDDNEAGVRGQYAVAEQIRAQGMSEQDRREIIRKLDDLERDVREGAYSEKGKRFSDEQYNTIMKKIRKLMDEVEEIQKTIKTVGQKVGKRHCWSCGTMLADSSLFCTRCGARQNPNAPTPPAAPASPTQPAPGIKCPICGTDNPAGAKQCKLCGKTFY